MGGSILVVLRLSDIPPVLGRLFGHVNWTHDSRRAWTSHPVCRKMPDRASPILVHAALNRESSYMPE